MDSSRHTSSLCNHTDASAYWTGASEGTEPIEITHLSLSPNLVLSLMEEKCE